MRLNTLPAIMAAIVTALAVDLGTIDLSGSDQVKQGTYERPPGSRAFAAIEPPTLAGSEPQARAAWYLETWTVPIRLWAPWPSSTPDARVARGRLLVEEAVVALDNLRANGGSAAWRCVTWAVTGVDPDPVGATALAGWAHATVTITLSFRRATGTGT